MGRNTERGITYYSVQCNHATKNEIRLLIADEGAAGYMVYNFILAAGYEHNGYYFNILDQDEREVFARETCKMDLATFDKIVASCIRRKLFDAGVAHRDGVLTSVEMQEQYVTATSERRRKGTTVEVQDELWLIPYDECPRNLSIVPRNNDLFSAEQSNGMGIVPRNNPQKKGKEKKGNESDGIANAIPGGQGQGDEGQGDVSSGALMQAYKALPKTKADIYAFIRDVRPEFIDPYADFWNIFAAQYGMPAVKTINKERRTKFRARIKEKEFQFPTILAKAAVSEKILSGTWFTFDWVMKSSSNYIKVLEGNYDKKDDQQPHNHQQHGKQPPNGETSADELEQGLTRKAAAAAAAGAGQGATASR